MNNSDRVLIRWLIVITKWILLSTNRFIINELAIAHVVQLEWNDQINFFKNYQIGSSSMKLIN